MNTWQVTPRPERLSELYFANYRQLPASFQPGVLQRVTFTVENLEHQTTIYHYQVVAALNEGSDQQQLGEGAFILANGRSRTTSQTITVPLLGNRVAVAVDLSYQGIGFGNSTPTQQTQSIDYWVTAVAVPAAQGVV